MQSLDQPISHLGDSRDRATPKATQAAGTATSWGRSLIYMRTLTILESLQAGVSRQTVPVFHFERCPVCHPTVHPNQEGSAPASAASISVISSFPAHPVLQTDCRDRVSHLPVWLFSKAIGTSGNDAQQPFEHGNPCLHASCFQPEGASILLGQL